MEVQVVASMEVQVVQVVASMEVQVVQVVASMEVQVVQVVLHGGPGGPGGNFNGGYDSDNPFGPGY